MGYRKRSWKATPKSEYVSSVSVTVQYTTSADVAEARIMGVKYGIRTRFGGGKGGGGDGEGGGGDGGGGEGGGGDGGG